MKKLIFILMVGSLFMGCNNSTEPVDCAGVTNGTAVEDACGNCNGDCVEGSSSSITCSSSDNNTVFADCADQCGGCSTVLENCGGDNYFSYNQSLQQAFYYFLSVTIDGVLVDSDDWVGAFKGDVCVGSRKGIYMPDCGGGICEVPAMGDNGGEETVGYMTSGDIPSFKIYDTSENKLYNAVASEYIPWAALGIGNISSLSAITNSVSNCPD